MTSSYCMRCKVKTGDVNSYHEMSANGRKMRKSSCANCGGNKTTFVSIDSQGVRPLPGWNQPVYFRKPMNPRTPKVLPMVGYGWDDSDSDDEFEGGALPVAAILGAVGGIGQAIGGIAKAAKPNEKIAIENTKRREQSGNYDRNRALNNRKNLRLVQKEYRVLLKRQEQGKVPASFSEQDLWNLATDTVLMGID